MTLVNTLGTLETKVFYGMSLTQIEDWPPRVALPSKHFLLFLACDACRLAEAKITAFARQTLKQGLTGLCAWGPDCERVHDIFDEVFVEEYWDGEDESVIMTTWHDDESLKEALWYFVHCATPAQAYEEGCRSWVAASVGNSEWSERIFTLLAEPARL